MLDVGETVTRVRTLDNGWSEIRYEGGITGYVKSEFLTDEGSAGTGSPDGGNPDEGADAGNEGSDDGNTAE